MPPQTKDKYGNYVKTDASGFITASADPIGTPQNAPVQPQITPTAQTTAQATNVVPGAISGSTGGAINPPTPTKDINLTIPPSVPSDILAGAPTSGQVLNKAKSMADQYQEFLTQRQARQAELLKASAPTEQETQLRQQLADINARAREATRLSEERQAPMFAITGEQAAIARQRAVQGQALADQINALVDSRKVQIDALTSQMEFDKENLDALANLQKLTKPEVLKTDVNEQTGDVIAISRDPSTGKVTSETIGNIGIKAKNQYTHQGTYQNDATGQSYFYGVTPDGKIDTIALPGSAGLKPGTAMATMPTVSPYTGVVNTILGSGKFTKDQSNAIINSINNGEDPVTVIKNNAKNIMGQTEATTVTKYESAKSAMQDLDAALKQFYADGGDTGIFKGNFEKVINKLGNVNDPRLVDLATQIQAQLQVYRNAISGTAYSEQEGKDILAIFPGINKGQVLNSTIVKARLKSFDSAIDGAYKATIGTNAYNKIKDAETSQNTQQIPDSKLSDQEAYAKYKELISGKNIPTQAPPEPTQPTQAPTTPGMFDWTKTYQPPKFNLGSFFK